jgi:5,10-methylenetetrahydromethanopterin reductase
MKIDFGVASGRNDKIADIPELARVAEDNGFVHLSFLDSQNLCRDVYSMMTLVALNTTRIHTGQTVTNPFTRHPSVTANATATVNELSGGRVFLGIGSGFSSVATMGLKARPIEEMRKSIQFFRDYMSGKEVEFDGVKMHSEWIRDVAPIVVAAEGPKSLEVAGALADGVVFMGGLPFFMKWKVDKIHQGAEKAGRDPSEIDIWVRSYIYVADSKEQAHREVSTVLSFNGGIPHLNLDNPEMEAICKQAEKEQPGLLDEISKVKQAMAKEAKKYNSPLGFNPWFETIDAPWAPLVTQRMIDNIHLVGKPEDICEGIDRYAQVGIKTIAASLYSIIDKKDMLKEIGEKVMPNFRN